MVISKESFILILNEPLVLFVSIVFVLRYIGVSISHFSEEQKTVGHFQYQLVFCFVNQ